jgi:hypothetical protein
MFQNILLGYSETLAGDTPAPGKGSKVSASGDLHFANMPAAWLIPDTARVNPFTNTSLSYHVYPSIKSALPTDLHSPKSRTHAIQHFINKKSRGASPVKKESS